MARQKRASTSVTDAQTRAASLKSIDAALDLSNGLTLAAYNTKIDATGSALDTYNTKLSDLDALLNELENLETELGELSGRMLAAVGVKYGKNSDEYEMAGGTRTSERKKAKRTPKPPTPPNP